MSKYEIEINVNQNTTGGTRAGQSQANMQELRERVHQAKTMEQSRELDVKKAGSSDASKKERLQNNFLTRIQTMLRDYIRSNDILSKTLKELSRRGIGDRAGGGGGGGRQIGGSAGSMFSSAITAGSRIQIFGAVVGAVLSAARYAWERVSEIGNAYIQTATQQLMTEGLAGFQRRGRGIYMAGEYGQGVHQRILAGGRFNGNASLSGAALRYGQVFGISAGEVGRMLGTFDIISGGRGNENFARAVAYARRGGIETELPILLNAIQDTLQEAVRAGVSDSSLATDMAQEIGMVMKTNPTSSVQAAIATQRNLQQVQTQVGRGRLSSLEEWEMYRATESYVNEQLADPQNSELIRAAVGSGILSQTQLENVRAGGGLPVEARDALVRFAAQRMPAAVRRRFLANIMETYGGEGDETERAQRAMWFLAGNMPSLMEGSPAQTIQALLAAVRANNQPEFNLPPEEAAVEAAAQETLTPKGTTAAGIVDTQISQENLLLGAAGQAAGNAVLNFNRNMLEAAGNLTKIAVPAINGMSRAMDTLGRSVVWATEKLEALAKRI